MSLSPPGDGSHPAVDEIALAPSLQNALAIMNNSISLELLATVTGGCGTTPSIPEDGGVAGPVGAPTPKFGRRKPKSHADELRDGNGGIVPKLPQAPSIPESGGIAGPVGDPTPF